VTTRYVPWEIVDEILVGDGALWLVQHAQTRKFELVFTDDATSEIPLRLSYVENDGYDHLFAGIKKIWRSDANFVEIMRKVFNNAASEICEGGPGYLGEDNLEYFERLAAKSTEELAALRNSKNFSIWKI
jgi:hypothetical protein